MATSTADAITNSTTENEWTSLFSSSRTKPFPSIFPSHKTPVTVDILYLGLLSGFISLAVAFISIFPTFLGIASKIRVFMRVITGLTIGVVIMACNFGQEWEVGSIRTHTAYRAGSGQEIYADLGISLGLRSVNITLKAVDEPHGDLAGETINYNERFSWAWGQGNPGFGPYAGPIQQAYRAAQVRGTPLPILWVAEYFTIDGEGVRFGRHYRHAGWYAHICIWTAFPLWILSLILFKMVVRLGAEALTLTGTMLLSAALYWALYRNPTELQIPFDGGILTTRFGLHWYLSLIMGVLCIVSGVSIFLLDYSFPGKLSCVFGNNPLNIVEQETGVEEDSNEGGEPAIRKKNLQTANRLVVTTLRLRGSKRSLKKITHSQESGNLAVPNVNEEVETETIDRHTSERPSSSVEFLSACPATYKDGQVTLKLDTEGAKSRSQSSMSHDNPAFEEEKGMMPF